MCFISKSIVLKAVLFVLISDDACALFVDSLTLTDTVSTHTYTCLFLWRLWFVVYRRQIRLNDLSTDEAPSEYQREHTTLLFLTNFLHRVVLLVGEGRE